MILAEDWLILLYIKSVVLASFIHVLTMCLWYTTGALSDIENLFVN